MKTKRKREGYLLIDHSCSPGVTPQEARRLGLDGPVVPGGVKFESATITCIHCQTLVVLNPNRSRERGWCARCDAYICDSCTAVRECPGPYKKVVEKILTDVNRGVLRDV